MKRLACFILGFQNCVQYGKNECQCSYSCKFANEYYEDSKELSEEQRKLLNSSWAAKRKISAEQREKRKAEELEAQKEMWIRIQEEMEKEKEREALESAEKEKEGLKDRSGKDRSKDREKSKGKDRSREKSRDRSGGRSVNNNCCFPQFNFYKLFSI